MRRTLVVLALAVTLAFSGCVAAVTGDTITYEASPTTVADDALSEHGFQQANESTFTVRRDAEIPFVGTREVVITNHVATYAKSTGPGSDGGSAAALMVVSTPQAEIVGQNVNPLGRVPPRELVDRVGDRAGDQTDVRWVGETSVTVLGAETTVEKYASTTETEDGTVETFVYVTRVAHQGDFVIAVGILPRQAEDDQSALFGMMEAIDHPVTAD